MLLSGKFSTQENGHLRTGSLMLPLPTSSPWLKTSSPDIAGSALGALTARRVQDSPPSEGKYPRSGKWEMPALPPYNFLSP